MALSKTDKTDIGTLIKLGVSEAIEPFAKQIQTNTEVIFGPKGDDGLVTEIAKQKNFNKTIIYIFSILTAIGATFTFLVMAAHSGIIHIG